jgi:hypothetical protein
MRRLKAVKDLSVLIIAPRRHDRKLWADLLKNCGINHPTSMGDVKQAAHFIGSGQADVVFVDESYGAAGIANVLIPARGVEFTGGRGVCLILCSKMATANDVLNARRLGFASLVILPASIDTIRKHLELAARYIPPSDEELGWSAMAKKDEDKPTQTMPTGKDEPSTMSDRQASKVGSEQKAKAANDRAASVSQANSAEWQTPPKASLDQSAPAPKELAEHAAAEEERLDKEWAEEEARQTEDDNAPMTTNGRSGNIANEEVVFL